MEIGEGRWHKRTNQKRKKRGQLRSLFFSLEVFITWRGREEVVFFNLVLKSTVPAKKDWTALSIFRSSFIPVSRDWRLDNWPTLTGRLHKHRVSFSFFSFSQLFCFPSFFRLIIICLFRVLSECIFFPDNFHLSLAEGLLRRKEPRDYWTLNPEEWAKLSIKDHPTLIIHQLPSRA